ncbi:small nucleolar ribonucleo protein complex subunit [Aspergillus avenaceus]|uniref:Small nucleolar ribonucleo protein complex subunit n=1 Tax=Aspergillus avenaceus TaxID=36643 RepID=A0A5N6TSM2_ASPAV|nr:small nucleolar ribonucleo protein complex subunit [Aspergillus avenaceus]
MDIHRCRFVPYNPQAINALAFSHPPSAELAGRGVPTLRLAVGRANGDIEIWNPMRGAWFQETVLRGGKDRSIEGLTWVLDPPEDGPDGAKIPGRLRLFSIGYSTAVTEWDIEKGQPLRHSSGNYGEIWCIAAQPRWQPTKRGKDGKWESPAEGEYIGQHLAAGCADGSIVILSTADNDIKYLRLMRPSTKRARVLSVTFQNRNTIVAGYADSSIRLFDIRNGQLLRTISLGKGPSGGTKELLVWSVKCLPDGTIVSGDSAGEVRFWDAKNYSLIQRLHCHLADTLDVAVSANGDTVVSGGADQRTVVYRKKDGEKGDKKSSRWVEVMHRRYHTHDVKTFAVYETRDISVVVSGGPDATPIVLPLREFGKEHHRKLSSLPQIPQITSSPSSRLVMSFWDREISIWRVSRGPTSVHENLGGQRHRLVGKVLIQGEENITSAMLSSDAKILVVATTSSVKVFAVRRRKGDEKGTLRIQKLEIPSALADDGARVVTVSPDSRWICVVRPNSTTYMATIKPASSAQEKPQVLNQVFKLNRAVRRARFEKASHGTLGEYEKTIRCATFSDNSRILAVGDLSGCIDAWSLEKADESSAPKKTSDDSDDSDDEDDHPVVEGERWRLTAAESPIPRLKSGVLLLSFRPPNPANQKLLADAATAPAESRLMALTSEHQLVEFDALDGKLSDWSRRNPKAYLPEEFRGVKDRAMGCLWDLNDVRERLWLYGTSWLWMFDLNQDFPSTEELSASADTHEGEDAMQVSKKSATQKRKREQVEDGENERKKANTGAGDKVSAAQNTVSLGSKIRKIVGRDESKGEWVSLEKERARTANNDDNDDEAYDHDEAYTADHDASLARLRRGPGPVETNNDLGAGTPKKQQTPQNQLVQTGNPSRRWWHTYKYRDILGIVPLSADSESESESESGSGFEVAVVERPMWDVELPGRYVREYE